MTTVLDQLQNISRDLDAAIRDLSRLEQEAAEAESAYRVAKAQGFLKATGSVHASTLAAPSSPPNARCPGCRYDLGRAGHVPAVSGCYARACRRLEPCKDDATCEHTWHACEPPNDNPAAIPVWRCGDCQAKWFRNREGEWHRD